jgi:hypothetical protein
MFKLASEYMFQNYLKGILVRMGGLESNEGGLKSKKSKENLPKVGSKAQ